jgi:hypothetical protein
VGSQYVQYVTLINLLYLPRGVSSTIFEFSLFHPSVQFPASDLCVSHMAPCSFIDRVAQASHIRAQVVLYREHLKLGYRQSRQHHFGATW